ncbi:hypothetical protein [Haloprofundus halobius]|uniref:hypothetical protein n=1 Tax=Haloprofundus halobius TaxID=2876194 RepID=UPI001CC9DB6A|nr:hypothetical protein [Haloprofundus halobius]
MAAAAIQPETRGLAPAARIGLGTEQPDSPGIVDRAIDAADAVREDADFKLWNATLAGKAFANKTVGEVSVDEVHEAETTTAKIGGSVMVVARGIIVAVVALIVLGALYGTDIVSDPDTENEWTNMTDTFADYGTTAFTLIGVGLIAVGAGVALSYFGGMGNGGGGR